MKRNILTIEHCLYLFAFLLALALRLIRLGSAPLSEYEANWALQALHLSQGKAILLGTQPLYALFTGFAFAMVGSSNGLARLFPALSGSLIVFVPFLWSRGFRRYRGAALITAFGLALDPGMVAAARLVGSPAPALTFVLLGLGAVLCRSAAWTGVFGGLALLTGIPVIPGVIALAVTWVLAKWLGARGWLAPFQPGDFQPVESGDLRIFLRRAAIFGVGTLVVAGTLFLFVPQGLAAVADTFTAYLRGWIRPSGVLVLRMVFALAVYQPLALIFGITGALRGWFGREPVVQRLVLWLVISLVLSLAYPARQAVDLVWSLVPLWALAGWEIQRHLPAPAEELEARWQAWAYALGVIVLMVVGWLGLIAGKAALAALAIGMVIVVAFIVSMWSTKVMRYGLVWGVCITLTVGMFAAASSVAWVHPNSAQEFWSISPVTGEAGLLMNTLEDLSQWKTGERQTIDIIVASNSNALRWLLRDFRNAQFIPEFTGVGVNEASPPSVVITYQAAGTPGMPVLYRGQDFILDVAPGWQQVFPNDWIRWLAFREGPVIQNEVILWARTDLFPGGVLEKSSLP